ncbi:hypothetical protein [Zymomonas mobilis]|uniref:hypothetical protein n=1 Tax=Zymomonas mobilis TaxID=542 RepID=UPI0039EA5A2C
MPNKRPKFPDNQSGQRIKVGLTGLAGVVLLVSFAAFLLSLAPKEDQTAAMANSEVEMDMNGRVNLDVLEKDPPRDPLAELGVSPGGSVKLPLPDLSSLAASNTQNIPASEDEGNPSENMP